MGANGRLAALEILKDWDAGRSREGRRRGHRGRPQRPRRRGAPGQGGMKPLRPGAARRRGRRRASRRSSTRASRPRPWPTRPARCALRSSKELGLSLAARARRSRASSRPSPDGRALRLWGDARRPPPSSRHFSAKDGERWPAVRRARSVASAALLARVLEMTPPDIDQPLAFRRVALAAASASACGGWAARTDRICCAGGPWRWRTSRPSGSRASS